MAGTTDTCWSALELHALADEIVRVTSSDSPVDLLDQLDALERIKSAAAAAQVAVSARFADTVEASDEVSDDGRRQPPRAMSLGAEVALAVRTSPYQGEQRLLLSRRLHDHLPAVLAALTRGEINEGQAFAVAREVAHLDADQRGRVDADLAA